MHHHAPLPSKSACKPSERCLECKDVNVWGQGVVPMFASQPDGKLRVWVPLDLMHFAINKPTSWNTSFWPLVDIALLCHHGAMIEVPLQAIGPKNEERPWVKEWTGRRLHSVDWCLKHSMFQPMAKHDLQTKMAGLRGSWDTCSKANRTHGSWDTWTLLGWCLAKIWSRLKKKLPSGRCFEQCPWPMTHGISRTDAPGFKRIWLLLKESNS